VPDDEKMFGDEHAARPLRFLPLAVVTEMVGWRKSKIHAEIRAGRFPAPVRIGSSSRFIEVEILGWMAQHIRRRDERARVSPVDAESHA
jgi:prophage regulatory protein